MRAPDQAQLHASASRLLARVAERHSVRPRAEGAEGLLDDARRVPIAPKKTMSVVAVLSRRARASIRAIREVILTDGGRRRPRHAHGARSEYRACGGGNRNPVWVHQGGLARVRGRSRRSTVSSCVLRIGSCGGSWDFADSCFRPRAADGGRTPRTPWPGFRPSVTLGSPPDLTERRERGGRDLRDRVPARLPQNTCRTRLEA